ncbi:hypothetical protein FOBRF1_015005 [Fusarium oxysporum]
MLACARDEDDSRRFDLAQARTLRPFATVDINKSHHHYAPPTNNFRRDALLKVNISVQAHTNKEIPWINGPQTPPGQDRHTIEGTKALPAPRFIGCGCCLSIHGCITTAPIEQVCQQPCHAACCMLALRRNWTLHTPYR